MHTLDIHTRITDRSNSSSNSSSTSTSTSTSTDPTTRRDLVAAVRSEWIKVRSVRSTPLLVGLAGAVGVGMSVILGRVVKDDPYDHLPFTIGNTFLVSTWLTTLFAVVAGVLLFTSEVQHGTLTVALTTRPSKRIVVGAKVVVAAALGLTMGAVGIVGGLVGGIASGMDAGDMSGAASGVAWALVLTTLAAVLGLGVGLLIRHSAAAVTSVLVWALAAETLVRGMTPPEVSRLMPFSAAHGLLGTRSATDTAETLAAGLSNVGNAAVFACHAIVAVTVGAVALSRRDA